MTSLSRHSPLVFAVTVAFTCLVTISQSCGPSGQGVPKASEYRSLIESKVPLDASVDEIKSFLDSQDIEYLPQPVRTDQFVYTELGITPGTYVFLAEVKGHTFSRLEIIFVLSEDLRYERLVLREHATLP